MSASCWCTSYACFPRTVNDAPAVGLNGTEGIEPPACDWQLSKEINKNKNKLLGMLLMLPLFSGIIKQIRDGSASAKGKVDFDEAP